MRMWMIPPFLLCNQHLLGEHLECHMIMGSWLKGRSLLGYVKIIELHEVKKRHDVLVIEMEKRGYGHKSPIAQTYLPTFGKVDWAESIKELRKRCAGCRTRFEAFDSQGYIR